MSSTPSARTGLETTIYDMCELVQVGPDDFRFQVVFSQRTTRFRTRADADLVLIEEQESKSWKRAGRITELSTHPYMCLTPGFKEALSRTERTRLRALGVSFWCAAREIAAELSSFESASS